MELTRTKAYVRRILRRYGLDLVPFGVAFQETQQQLLRQVEQVIDVGANTGQYAELIRSLGYRGAISSYEPGSHAYAQLHERSAADPKWQVTRAAIGAEPGTAELHIAENSVSSSILVVGESHVHAAPTSRAIRSESVRVVTLDQEFRGNKEPIYLKIDTQGYELAVLEGASGTLELAIAIQCELSFIPLYAGQADWLDVCRHLQRAGFSLAHIEPGFQDPASGHLLQVDGLFVRARK